MMSVAADSIRGVEGLEEALLRLGEQFSEFGLNVSVFDRACTRVDSMRRACSLCQLAAASSECDAAEVAEAVAAAGQSLVLPNDAGCCRLAVPIYQRRRLLGVLVACYPPREMLEGKRLVRLAQRLDIEPEMANDRARMDCRHNADEAAGLLRLLESTLRREQEMLVAAGELNTLSANLATTYEELSLLYRISGQMRVTQQPQEFLAQVCSDLLEVMSIESAAGIIYGRGGAEDVVVLAGSPDLNVAQVRLLAATSVASRVGPGHRSVLDNHFEAPASSGVGSAVRTYIAAPLIAEDKAIGMLLGFNKKGREFDSVDLKLVNSIGSQASVFLNNHRLYADLQDLLMGVLHALTSTIDAKDPYTRGHSQRVAMLSKMLAQACGFPPAKVQQIYLSGLLHDIGKIGVPEAVLCKDGRLTNEEYELIKRHPGQGARILQGIRQLDDVVVGILTHHERPDGKGYPQKLSGAAVPIEGRIVGLADVFDAMTSDRTYRKALSLENVIDEIRRFAGAQFDQELVNKLLAMDLPNVMAKLREASQSATAIASLQEQMK
jgi:HD-GYP domain-containing protein (c-di-GMP phosphodiesterase class II)